MLASGRCSSHDVRGGFGRTAAPRAAPASSGPPGSAGGSDRRDAAWESRSSCSSGRRGSSGPSCVERTELDEEGRRLDIRLSFEFGGMFACPDCGAEGCKAYDTKARW